MKKSIIMFLLATCFAASTSSAWAGKVLIDSKTAAETYELRITKYSIGASIQLLGVLGAGESITLQRWNGSTWEQLQVSDANAPSLTQTNHIITFYGAQKIRINKPITAANSGVYFEN